MALPFILWGAAAAVAAVGVKKGIDAKGDFDRAERIGKRAQNSHEDATKKLDQSRSETNQYLQNLGKTKVDVFKNQFKFLVDFSKKLKGNSSAKLAGFDEFINPITLKELEKMTSVALELEKTAGSSIASGALAGLAAYGAVGAIGTASTGTAIATLSGAAAKSATLAWLGGGSLAAGGFGVAGGMVALGGIALAPALAIGGFMMASKAEEALTKAREYEGKVEKAVADIEKGLVYFRGIRANATEMNNVILSLVKRFEEVKVTSTSASDFEIERMFVIGKVLKQLLDMPILTKDDKPVSDLSSKINNALSSAGALEYRG